MNAKEDEIYRLAVLVWGEETGQVIAGKGAVRVFTITGDRPLFAIEHPEAYRVARMFLGRLAFMAARVAKVGNTPPASARDPREGLEQYCLGCDQPSSRDCGCPAGVGYRRPSPAVGGLVAPPPVDPDAPRAGIWDPAKVPPDELAQLAFGPDEK